MKVIIPGGTGQVGQILSRAFKKKGHEVIILSRTQTEDTENLYWDSKSIGEWVQEIEGADAIINLAGRSVNCRYNNANMKLMMDSRVDSTHVIGLAITNAKNPPRIWIQASTATIYAHSFNKSNDETTGIIGGDEPNVPKYWKFSVDITKAWELTQAMASTPNTRKVALRSAMIMSPDKNGIFDTLSGLTRYGLGGNIANGSQFISWIHEYDFIRSIEFIINQESIEGPVNLTSPHPLPQSEFMKELRIAMGVKFGLPATRLMIEIGAFFLRTDSELILKSRKVLPGKLIDAGFMFKFSEWKDAAAELVNRMSHNA